MFQSYNLIPNLTVKENIETGAYLSNDPLPLDDMLKTLGLPAGVQGIIFSLSNVVIQSSINSFGAVTVAGNSAAANIESFVYFAMNAFHQATISFTGQNMGAGNYKRINKIVITGEICVTVVGLVLGNLVVFFGHPLLSIYSSSSKVIAAGMVRLKVVSAVSYTHLDVYKRQLQQR